MEREPKPDAVILSMRTKVFLGGLCFFLVLAIAAYPTLPRVTSAIGALGQNDESNWTEDDPENEPEPGITGEIGLEWVAEYGEANVIIGLVPDPDGGAVMAFTVNKWDMEEPTQFLRTIRIDGEGT
jgi:hypothetical protein